MADGGPTYSAAEYVEQWSRVETESAALAGASLADQLADLEASEPGFVGQLLDELGPVGSLMLAYDAGFWLRPKQLEFLRLGRAGVWRVLMFVAGRGNGKTRAAAEWIIDRLQRGARTVVLCGPSEGDVKEFMIGGHKRRCDGANGSGLLDCLPPWIESVYKEDDGVIEFPQFNAVAHIHSAHLPEYRGPEPDTVWGDELIKWRYPEKLLRNFRLACRAVGKLEPQILLTTSPKRFKFLRDLVMQTGSVKVIHGDSEENVGNTDEAVYLDNLQQLTDPRTGELTRQGKEELGGKLGLDEEGDLFPLGLIEENRKALDAPLTVCAVAIDPAGSKTRRSDNTGIVAVGRVGDIHTGHGYVLEDATERYAWELWAEKAFELAERHGASVFVIERSGFADSVAANLRTVGALRGYDTRTQTGMKHLVELVHARDGKDAKGRAVKASGRVIKIVEVIARGDKAQRAGPVSTLYQTRRMHHVEAMPRLDTEMSDWDPETSDSPGGLDAVVHAATYIFALDRPPSPKAASLSGLAAANNRLDESAPRAGRQSIAIAHPTDRGWRF